MEEFPFSLFPEAIVAIARFPQGWISSVTSGRMDNAVVMEGMISSRPVVSMMELGIEMAGARWKVDLGPLV